MVLLQLSSRCSFTWFYAGPNSGYNNHFDDIAVGWVAGLSYAKPEMGILASLTYRSEIDHKTTIHEDVPLADLLGIDYSHQNSGTIHDPRVYQLKPATV